MTTRGSMFLGLLLGVCITYIFMTISRNSQRVIFYPVPSSGASRVQPVQVASVPAPQNSAEDKFIGKWVRPIGDLCQIIISSDHTGTASGGLYNAGGQFRRSLTRSNRIDFSDVSSNIPEKMRYATVNSEGSMHVMNQHTYDDFAKQN
jgi:hypothetical protein